MKNNNLKSKTINNTKFFRFYFLDFILSRKANGFTLIETLVAVTILSAAMAGIMSLSIKNIGTASVSQDQLVAFYLGQEAIEYVRNVRDTNFLKESADWLDGLDKCKISDSVGCYIDVIKDPVTVMDCGSSGCPKLDFDGVNYTYKLGGADGNTVFTRTVKIDKSIRKNEDEAQEDEAQIDITVSWTGKYGTKTMNLQDNIFNWRDDKK